MRKSGELLKTMLLRQDLQVQVLVVFDAEKRLRQFLWELPQFLLSRLPGSPLFFQRLPLRDNAAPKIPPSNVIKLLGKF